MRNERQGHGYDAILFGQVEPTRIDVDELRRRLVRPDHRLVKQSLREVELSEPRGFDGEDVTDEGIDLLATYDVPTLPELESVAHKLTRLWRLLPG